MLWIQVLNRKLNHLNISEFTAKLYAPFKSKEEDMKNAAKTAMLLVKLVFLLLKKLVKHKYSFAFIINVSEKSLNPFAPGDFAEKRVLKLVEWFSGHCRAIKS